VNPAAAPIPSLHSLLEAAPPLPGGTRGRFAGLAGDVRRAELDRHSACGGQLEALRGRSVLLATSAQLGTAVALLELDGVARRIVLCTPDLSKAQLQSVAATAAADALVIDGPRVEAGLADLPAGLLTVRLSAQPDVPIGPRHTTLQTEWILLTSGTTGTPKLVAHSLESLAGTLPRRTEGGKAAVWSTFYDIRRYGGLQIYLRAVLGNSDLVLSDADESTPAFLARAAAAGVTHISGTPSHWRRALMSGAANLIDPDYVRLSGELADQTILDNLRSTYPRARIGHAFASTEAGVAFDVNDGLAGFPADYLGQGRSADPGRAGIEMKVENGTLWIRSGRTAARYLGEAPLTHADGFVDTGDLVELVDGRYHFRGRQSGVINVGGLKVHPEEVESVINADPRVRMSRVHARRSPITGAVVVAEVVLNDPDGAASRADEVTRELLETCRTKLAKHKVPTMLRLVPALELTPAGKLVRPRA
jgi:acyl-CoA synthetase (AMP-forming)/AMP-acid ligase II